MDSSENNAPMYTSPASPAVFIDEEALSRTAEQITQTLAADGWMYLQGAKPMEWFETIAARLGKVVHRSDVIVDPVREVSQQKTRSFRPQRPSIYQHDGLVFHTDSRDWNILGWYCVEQDSADGASRLLDVGDVAQAFSLEELECLSEIDICHLNRDPQTGAESISPTPLLTRVGNSWLLFYAPWLMRDTYEGKQRDMLERFRIWLQQKEETCAIEIKLKPGETLFVNNNRVMHARKPIEPTSRRHLIRISIDTGVVTRGAVA
jgi:hypothetical protein